MSDNIIDILQEIAANTNHMRHRLDDMQSLLMQPAIKEAFKQTMCDHNIGARKSMHRDDFLVFNTSSEDIKRSMTVQFKYCSKCGMKL